jgi:hypothetical protein
VNAFLSCGLISVFLQVFGFLLPCLYPPPPCFVLTTLYPVPSLSSHLQLFFRNRCSPLVMILYHYLIARCFALTFVYVLFLGRVRGLLPRLVFGPVTKTAWTLYHSLGRLSIPQKTLCYQALRLRFFLSETSPFPPNFSTGYHRYMCFT